MKTLLRIDSSARKQGSCSRALADHFQARWCEAHPGGQVRVRDLADAPVPHLDNATIAAFQAGEGGGQVALSDTLIAELAAADQLLISSPLYNFSLPSTLKAYLDHVIRRGHTFAHGPDGYRGLLEGKRACVITTRGGTGTGDDFQTPHLERALSFIGFESIDIVAVEGMASDSAAREAQLARARQQIDHVTTPQHARAEPVWIGDFSPADRAEISALRQGQADAIQRGDAHAYMQLCTQDIHWMFPGRDVVSGHSEFIAAQAGLRRGAKILEMRKLPIRIERSGDIAVEVGRQELTTVSEGARAFPPRQKYTHVFRKTSQGWRFAVLMSNSCE